MNHALLQPLPLASDTPFPSEQECIDQIGAHAHHSFSAAGVPDQFRRDGILGQSSSAVLNPLSSGSGARYMGPRSDAHSRFQSGTTSISDSAPGSISTSPSSNASFLGYPSSSTTASSICSNQGLGNIANNTYSNPPLFSFPPNSSLNSFGMSTTARRMSSLTDSQPTTMLPPTRSPGMGAVSPSLGASARDNYTTSTPGLHRHPHTTLSPRSHSDLSRYSSLPDTPRSVLPTTMPVSSSPYGAPSLMNYSQPDRGSDSPPFNAQETYHELTCEGQPVTPQIEAKIDKGFFLSSDSVWTCYRRNYFAVTVSYTINPHIPNARLYLNRNGNIEQIQSFAVQLSAAVDGTGGKSIELIQHTPKRDKGPQMAMKKELLAPTPPGKAHDHSYAGFGHTQASLPGPLLPLQKQEEQSHQYNASSHPTNLPQHSFDRIQFKSATANNGKRRAQQQYYHLIVELYANVQSPRDDEPTWVKIAARASSPVVVRGRSPSHYQNEGPHSNGTSRGGSGAGAGGLGHPSLGSNGGTAFGRGYTNSLAGSRTGGMGGGMYRGNTYSLDPSPVGSHSVSSASSLSGGPVEGLVGDQHMVDEDGSSTINAHDGYQYYPGPLYEGIHGKSDAPGLPLPDRRIKEEFPGPSSIAPSWQIGGCGRFQGMESSRGFYPGSDLHAHAGY